MFNLNSIPIPQNEDNDSNKNFPTVGLKSILQNSDLLELLLKPISSPGSVEKEKSSNATLGSTTENYDSDLSSLNFDDLLKPNKPQFDHDYFSYQTSKVDEDDSRNQSKSYGNAFLGPSLWDKDDIFQGEKFGVEYLGIDEFLNENNLNEADLKFLDRLQSSEPIAQDTQLSVSHKTSSSTMDSFISSPVEESPILTKPPIFNDPTMTIKVKDDSKIVKHLPNNKPSISTLISQWKDDNDESDSMHADEVPSKKFFDERLTLQPTLKKSKKQFVPNELKDDKYWARRKKNNVAAKRSRDTRRFKENQIVIAATYLEHENEQLKKQLEECKEKMAQMQARLNRYESGSNAF